MKARYFKPEEFMCKCCGKEGIQDILVEAADELRDQLGRPVIITSGWRCANHPDEVDKTTVGYHQRGLAMDIACEPYEIAEIVAIAHELGFEGIGYSETFIHLDLRSKTAGWFY